MIYDLIIAGGGAAGFFAAINYAEKKIGSKILMLEKSQKLLSKVKISGGGRCNVTNACFDPRMLAAHYPRGERELLGLFHRFGPSDTIEWFENRGVELKTEEDMRVFPVSDNSMTIVNCLLTEAQKYGIDIRTNAAIINVEISDPGFRLQSHDGSVYSCSNLLIATGGSPKEEFYHWLKKPGHSIVKPVPSLFTFNITDKKITQRMGLSVQDARVSIAGMPFESRGPLLITHWGFSGPAVLRLSSLAARELFEKDYKYKVIIDWLPDIPHEELREFFYKKRNDPDAKKTNSPAFDLPRRLWEFFLEKSAIPRETRWAEISNRMTDTLLSILKRDAYDASGKTTFKEEFVTCGGVNTAEVDFRTMQSKKCPGLYFAGEVLNIDGVTGGFNFQNAWTTAWVAAEGMGSR